ncbi:hypothetical protein K239x_24950 [Planctomycetes bacterium K23_9]|uniref:Uncharacterized protein n=2 Tax=Stieleria marina TaxID=1930275 RepID=A0A517NTT8_9BACT|nr:hypothetical protein K239x_24950 [Planctomycetes bacterium K23_9]
MLVVYATRICGVVANAFVASLAVRPILVRLSMMAEKSVDILPDIDTTPRRRRDEHSVTKRISSPARYVHIATGIHFVAGMLVVCATPVILTIIDSSSVILQRHHFSVVPVIGLAMMLYAACLPATNSLLVSTGLILQTLAMVLVIFCQMACGVVVAMLKPGRPVPPGMDDKELMAAALVQGFATAILILATVIMVTTMPMLVSLWMVRKHVSLSRRIWFTGATIWLSGIAFFLFGTSLLLEKVVVLVRTT